MAKVQSREFIPGSNLHHGEWELLAAATPNSGIGLHSKAGQLEWRFEWIAENPEVGNWNVGNPGVGFLESVCWESAGRDS